MSTFYLSPSCLGLPLGGPLPPVSQQFSLPLIPHAHLAGKSGMDTLKSGGCSPLDVRPEDSPLAHSSTIINTTSTSTTSNNTSSIKGRCRSPITQPLRHRQLPASFWQEPNVPRGHLAYPHLHYPFPYLHWTPPPCSSSTPPSPSSPGEVRRGEAHGGGPGKQNGVQVHKEFLDRLQSAQARGYDLASSRFPITEFLFYNYGLRSYLDSSSSPSSCSSASSEIPASVLSAVHPHAHHHPRSCGSAAYRAEDPTGSPRRSGAASKSAASRGSEPPPRLPNGVCGSVGLTLPTVCPYLGYNCPNLHSGRPHRLWDCVLGQAAAASSAFSTSSSSSSSPSLSSLEEGRGGGGEGSVWKGGRGGKTASAYPGRYHPFARV